MSREREIGGFIQSPDWPKMGPSLLIASCLILAVRTAKWPPRASGLTSSDRDLDAEVQVEKERAQVMKAVFPDKADFEAGDKKRWELTTEHWDEKLVEVPLQ